MTIAAAFAAVLPLVFAAASGGERDRCYTRHVSPNGGKVMIYSGDRACHDFDAPVTLSGLWIDEFEGQRLIAQGRTLDDAMRARRDIRSRHIWFTTDEETRWDARAPKRGGGSQVYRIRVTGRYARKADSASPGGFGHLGGSDGLFPRRPDYIDRFSRAARPLAAIIGVDADVAMGEVARPHGRAAFA